MGNIELKKIYEWPAIAQIAAIILCGMLIYYIGYMFDISSLRQQISSDKQEETSLLSQYRTMVQAHVSSLNAVLQVPRLKQILDNWQKKFITTAEFPALQDKILNMAELNQLKVASFNPLDEKQENGYTILPIKIQVTGTYEQTATFISQIANIDKMVVIANFEMSSIAGTNAPTQPINSNNPMDTMINVNVYKI